MIKMENELDRFLYAFCWTHDDVNDVLYYEIENLVKKFRHKYKEDGKDGEKTI